MDKSIPQIRFPGFKEPWEQRKLGDIGSTYSGLSGKTAKDFGHGNANFVTYLNVFKNPIADLEGTENIEIDNKQTQVLKGDVFFTTSSETPEEVGMSSIWMGNQPNTYLNSFCFGYRPTVDIDRNFLAYVLRSPAVRSKIIVLAQGISRYNISKKKMMEIKIPVPSIPEQKAVGNFFIKLDEMITLHQRKLNLLRHQKKGLLQKLFPQAGENEPELRFAGFTEPWEQREFSSVVKKFDYGLNAPSKKFDGINQYLRITDIDDQTRKYQKTDLVSPDTNLDIADDYKLFEGDILFARTGASVGKSFIYNENDGLTYFAGYLIRAKIIDDFVPEFFFEQTLSDRYKKFVSTTSQRSGQPGINAKEYGSFPVWITSVEEQKVISTFFEKIDSLITLHQLKVESLSHLKKSLLDRMIV